MMPRRHDNPNIAVLVSEQGGSEHAVSVPTTYPSLESFATAVKKAFRISGTIHGFHSPSGLPVRSIAQLRGLSKVTFSLSRPRARRSHSSSPTTTALHGCPAPPANLGKLQQNGTPSRRPAPSASPSPTTTPFSRRATDLSTGTPKRLTSSFSRVKLSNLPSHLTPSGELQLTLPSTPSSTTPRRLSATYNAPTSSRDRSRTGSPCASRRSASSNAVRSTSRGTARHRTLSASVSRLPLYDNYCTAKEVEEGIKNGSMKRGRLVVPDTWLSSTAHVEVDSDHHLTVIDPTAFQNFAPKRNRALPGDIVVLRLDARGFSDPIGAWATPVRKASSGSIVAVEKRAARVFYGVYDIEAKVDPEATPGHVAIRPANPAFPKVLLPASHLEHVSPQGSPVLVMQFHDWPSTSRLPIAHLVGRLGSAVGSPLAVEERVALCELGRLVVNKDDVAPAASEEDLPVTEFAAAVVNMTATLQQQVTSGARRDLRKDVRPFLFLDGKTEAACAFSCTKLRDGHRVGVHAVDMGYFVKEGGDMDHLLRRRLKSIQLPHSFLPLVPTAAAARVSLDPGASRPCLSVMWTRTPEGEDIDVWAGRSLVTVRCALGNPELTTLMSDGTFVPVGVCGGAEEETSEALLEEIRSFLSIMERQHEMGGHRYVKLVPTRSLQAAAFSPSSAVPLVDPLVDLARAHSKEVDMRNIVEAAEHLANKHLVSAVAAVTCQVTLPTISRFTPNGVEENVRRQAVALPLFDCGLPEIGHSHLSTSPLYSYINKMRRDTTPDAVTHFTTPFDSYVDIVVQRMAARVLSSKSADDTMGYGDVSIATPSIECGLGRWKPGAVKALLVEYSQKQLLEYAAYNRLVDCLLRTYLHAAPDQPQLQLTGQLVGLEERVTGLIVAVWFQAYKLLRWLPAEGADGWRTRSEGRKLVFISRDDKDHEVEVDDEISVTVALPKVPLPGLRPLASLSFYLAPLFREQGISDEDRGSS